MAEPRYMTIASDLRDAITRGDYAVGAQLPTVVELTQRYEVSGATARQAIGILRAEGLVSVGGRRGTTVRDRSSVRLTLERHRTAAQSSTGRLGPWETACDTAGMVGATQLIDVTTEVPPPAIATLLGLAQDVPAVRRQQRMTAGTSVAQLQDTWIPVELAAGTPLGAPAKVIGGITRCCATLGHPPASVTETVRARGALKSEAGVLDIEPGSSVLETDRLVLDADDRPLYVARAVAAGDRVETRYAVAL